VLCRKCHRSKHFVEVRNNHPGETLLVGCRGRWPFAGSTWAPSLYFLAGAKSNRYRRYQQDYTIDKANLMHRFITFCIVLGGALTSAVFAAEPPRFLRQDEWLFLHCADVAAQLDWELKIIQPDRLATFCRDGDENVCIPILLKPSNHLSKSDLYVRADVLVEALGFQVRDLDGNVTILNRDDAFAVTPRKQHTAYNSVWSEGRGFRTGQTLPDIPLVDLEGNEVRFGQFLGKRYIIYCWASW
jgi:hypothetical protein